MSARIEVDMIACDGHGVCAELLPERIGLDEWGYPVIDSTAVPPELGRHARRAVALCPRLALRLRESR
ncbi:ferredoxin [Actinokineospora sp. 24-640]